MSELKAKARSMQGAAKTQAVETISALQPKQMEATAALKGLKRETGNAWARMKKRLDARMEDPEASFDRADTQSVIATAFTQTIRDRDDDHKAERR